MTKRDTQHEQRRNPQTHGLAQPHSHASETEFRPLAPEQAELFEQCPYPVLVLDLHFRIRYLNPATEAIGNVSRASLIGAHVWTAYPELRGSIFEQAYESVLKEGQPSTFENFDVAAQKWHAVRAYPADDGVVAMLEDVSERRLNERALLESERALRRAQSLASLGSWSHTGRNGLQLSAEAYRVIGLDQATSAVDSLELSARMQPDQLRLLQDKLRSAEPGTDIHMTLQFTRFDDRTVDLDVMVRVAKVSDGNGLELYGTIQDVTLRNRANEELRRSEETLRLAQEAAGIGSFERDLRTKQTRWSEQLLRIVGVDPTSVDQRLLDNDPTMQFIHPDDQRHVREAFSRAVKTGNKLSVRNRIVRRNGEIRHLLSTAMLVRDVYGSPARIVGTALDITDQVMADERERQLSAKLQQAQKLESLGVLAGGIAHDFNNLLVGILGNASLALPEIGASHRARESLVAIETAAQRAAELTRQLLAYAGKGRFVMELIDASALVQEMSALLTTVVSRNASVQLQLASNLPAISVDATQFRQVLMNLITNASDALGETPGRISVRTSVEGRTSTYLETCVPGTNAEPGMFVCVEVADTGSGMDAETVSRIFDPFFSTKFTGRGLGLAATLGIMRSHQGAVHVSSDVGSGTTFCLCFPASAETAVVSKTPSQPSWTSADEVLVVDDEPTVGRVASAMLSRRGFAVTAVESGEDALALFRASPNRFALVLLDLTMPGMDGETTFRALREVRSDIRVVLMSGYDESDVTRRFVGQGLAGFLQKPFRAEDLYDTVARTIGMSPG